MNIIEIKRKIKELEFKEYLPFLFLLLLVSCSTTNNFKKISREEKSNKILTQSFKEEYKNSIKAKMDILFLLARDAEINQDYQRSFQYYNLITDYDYALNRLFTILDFFKIIRVSNKKDLSPNERKKETHKIYKAWYNYQMGNKNKIKKLLEEIEKESKKNANKSL